MDFSNRSAGALLLMTVTLAALHALIPSHWLAFALVGKSQRWTTGRTLRIAALAGVGHVLITVLLGLGLTFAGKALGDALPESLEHGAASLLLISLGVYFVVSWRRGGHVCSHPHDHESETALEKQIGTNKTAVGALVLGLTLSPCLELLPVFLAATRQSWSMVLTISMVMAATTLGLMLLLVWLTLMGLERLNLHGLEANEGFIIGGILILLGILLFFL